MGARSRQRKSGAQLERVIDAVGNKLNDDSALELSDTVRQNHRLVLEERRTAQQIRESRHRLATEEEMLRILNDEVIRGAFVTKESIRAQLLERFVPTFGVEGAQEIVDAVLPVDRHESNDLNTAIVDAWKRRHGG